MKLVVLAATVDTHITFTNHLPYTWKHKNNKNIVVTNIEYVEDSVSNSEFTTELALRISHNLGTDPFDRIPYELNHQRKEAIFTRLGKSIQQAYLKAALKDTPNYKPIPTWSKPKTAILNPTKLYVLKPENGARGIGQIYFCPGVVTLAKINTVFSKINDGVQIIDDGGVCDISKKDVSVNKEATPQPTKTKTEQLKEALKDNDGIKYISDRDNHIDEGYDLLRAELRASKGVICEYVENIVAEFRVITGRDGVPFYCVQRKLEKRETLGGIEIRQGCGNEERPIDNIIKPDGTTHPLNSHFFETVKGDRGIVLGLSVNGVDQTIDPILKAITTLKLPMHSFDVFLTSNDKWGIFEFCPQFGVEAVPQDLLVKQSMEYIEKTLKQLAQS